MATGGSEFQSGYVDDGGPDFRTDEVVVSLVHQRILLDRLDRWGARPEIMDSDRRLGLAQVSIDASAAVTHLNADRDRLIERAREGAQRGRRTQREHRRTDLDLLLSCLWQYFGEEYSGWVPIFGKNRVLRRPSGAYVIAGGDRGKPSPVPNHVIAGGGEGELVAAKPERTAVSPRGLKPGTGARVGVIDTQIFSHPWLSGAFVAAAGAMFWPYPETPPPDEAQHATFVTGLILRQAPGAVVDLRAALDEHAIGDSWLVAKAIADLGVRSTNVVNLSLGCTTEDGQPPLVLSAAIGALGPDSVVVAAAGNHGNPDGGPVPAPVFPAALDDVVAVGALDGDVRADFSPDVPWVDAMAQGVDLASTCDLREGGQSYWAVWSGTSFAAALVAGEIAARQTGGRSPREVWRELTDSAKSDDRGRPIVQPAYPGGWPPDELPKR